MPVRKSQPPTAMTRSARNTKASRLRGDSKRFDTPENRAWYRAYLATYESRFPNPFEPVDVLEIPAEPASVVVPDAQVVEPVLEPRAAGKVDPVVVDDPESRFRERFGREPTADSENVAPAPEPEPPIAREPEPTEPKPAESAALPKVDLSDSAKRIAELDASGAPDAEVEEAMRSTLAGMDKEDIAQWLGEFAKGWFAAERNIIIAGGGRPLPRPLINGLVVPCLRSMAVKWMPDDLSGMEDPIGLGAVGWTFWQGRKARKALPEDWEPPNAGEMSAVADKERADIVARRGAEERRRGAQSRIAELLNRRKPEVVEPELDDDDDDDDDEIDDEIDDG